MEATSTSAVGTPIALIFKVNDDLLPRAIEGLSEQDLWHRPTEKNNPMLWIIGHVVETRTRVLQILGERIDTGWGKLFERGAPLRDQTAYPSLPEILRTREEVNSRLYARFDALDDAQLTQPARGIELPRAKTVADQLAFFGLHECYHVGQMGYVRKALGRPGMVG